MDEEKNSPAGGEEKVEEVKIEDTKIEDQKKEGIETEETKIEEVKEEKKCCSKKSCKGQCKCKKCGAIFAGVVLVILLLIGFGYRVYRQKVDIGPNAVKAKISAFLKDKVPATSKTEIGNVQKDGTMYKATIKVDNQEVAVYVTADGKKMIQEQAVMDLDKKAGDDAAKEQAQAPEKTEAETKTDVPTVDLFVMSYCPYGLQMERGALPAVEALGNKIKFNLKFVGYTLHGQKEVDENTNQYCVAKTQPAKLNAYLKCFWKDSKGTAEACMKTTGVNVAQVTTCVTEAKKQFSLTEKAFDINKDEVEKFDVQGSPTLVVNGTTISSGRDSASVLKAICSGFNNQPKECQAKLSDKSPVAGFDDQSAGSGSSDASCGN